MRSGLTIAGIALALATLATVEHVGGAYKAQLSKELNSMGLHLMLVPLGCPYDASVRVLKGNTLETSFPEAALARVRSNSEVDVAAPMIIAAIPRPDQGRTDMFVGLDESGIRLKRWWEAERGRGAFSQTNSIILGSEAGMLEMRNPGDALYSPELQWRFTVDGILKKSGTSDDSLFFIPLATAQRLFQSEGKLTAIAVRLKNPAELTRVAEVLKEIPGVQVVTLTEMMGAFLNIIGSVRTLLQSIIWVALSAAALGVANTLLMSVAERLHQFALYRAIGASKTQVFLLILGEGLLLTFAGIAAGIMLAVALASATGAFVQRILPYSVSITGGGLNSGIFVQALVVGVIMAVAASILPGWRAARVQPAELLKGTG